MFQRQFKYLWISIWVFNGTLVIYFITSLTLLARSVGDSVNIDIIWSISWYDCWLLNGKIDRLFTAVNIESIWICSFIVCESNLIRIRFLMKSDCKFYFWLLDNKKICYLHFLGSFSLIFSNESQIYAILSFTIFMNALFFK